jgi:xanthine dehydrogenase/oxidase
MYKAVLHVDSVYPIPNIRVTGHTCKTNLAPNTAFRGFGGPQAMMVKEAIMTTVSARLPDIKPHELRRANMYHNGDVTYYGQTMEDCLVWLSRITS